MSDIHLGSECWGPRLCILQIEAALPGSMPSKAVKKDGWNFPGWPKLLMQGAWVPSLVGELDLSCSTQDLYLKHVGLVFLADAHELLVAACGI